MHFQLQPGQLFSSAFVQIVTWPFSDVPADLSSINNYQLYFSLSEHFPTSTPI